LGSFSTPSLEGPLLLSFSRSAVFLPFGAARHPFSFQEIIFLVYSLLILSEPSAVFSASGLPFEPLTLLPIPSAYTAFYWVFRGTPPAPRDIIVFRAFVTSSVLALLTSVLVFGVRVGRSSFFLYGGAIDSLFPFP